MHPAAMIILTASAVRGSPSIAAGPPLVLVGSASEAVGAVSFARHCRDHSARRCPERVRALSSGKRVSRRLGPSSGLRDRVFDATARQCTRFTLAGSGTMLCCMTSVDSWDSARFQLARSWLLRSGEMDYGARNGRLVSLRPLDCRWTAVGSTSQSTTVLPRVARRPSEW
jgi:hypothetical protein